ncbi:hypothetical protein A8A01_24235 [Ewingella americana]|nr:hypothetical protein A8A01_24235 [Ewingella americana]
MSVRDNPEILMDCYRAFSRHDDIFDELIKESCESISSVDDIDAEAKLIVERMKEQSEYLDIEKYFAIWGEIRNEKKVDVSLKRMNITKLWPMDYEGNIPLSIIRYKIIRCASEVARSNKKAGDTINEGESLEKLNYWYKALNDHRSIYAEARPTNFEMTNELIMAVYHYLSGKGKVIALEGKKIKEEYLDKLYSINELLTHPLFDLVRHEHSGNECLLFEPRFIDVAVEVPPSNRNDNTLGERVLAYELLKAFATHLDDSRLITSVKQFMEASFVETYVETITIRRIRDSIARSYEDLP